ncbi:hypothetical protein F2P56_025020 [Juglans regia]|uniref:Protein NIM1-INTERACTING 1-like n=2 Tax=Juglans regia TaxID=51240 RepID=A0A2I4DKL7_JUGRE|nr:protein NIM1-INTERACTING 1-like [Juglans regia]KAF5455447.1 hypothetical protein F2P56_025020 [Juglans regia]
MADNNKSSRIRSDKREEEEEEEEDVKMEKFFALIRSFREARNYYKRKEMNEMEKKNTSHKKTKRAVGGEQSSCNWVPKFEQEDFAKEVVEFRRTPLIFRRPDNEEKNKKKGEDDGDLDLRLTL